MKIKKYPQREASKIGAIVIFREQLIELSDGRIDCEELYTVEHLGQIGANLFMSVYDNNYQSTDVAVYFVRDVGTPHYILKTNGGAWTNNKDFAKALNVLKKALGIIL